MSTNNHLTTARLNTMEQNGAHEADNTDMEYYLETSQSLRSNDASAMAMELVTTADNPHARTTLKPLGFLDLPPEVRVLIYQHVLTKEGYEIGFKWDESRSSGIWIKSGTSDPHTSDCETFKSGGILTVCREISLESIQVLYEQNTFFVGWIADLEAMLDTIGEKVKLLHSVRIGALGNSWCGSEDYDEDEALALETLVQTKTLSRLQIGSNDKETALHFAPDASLLVDMLKPLLKKIYTANDRSLGKVLEAVQICPWGSQHVHGWSCGYVPYCSYEREFQEYLQAVRDQVGLVLADH